MEIKKVTVERVENIYTIELKESEVSDMIEILRYSRMNFDSSLSVQTLARVSYEILKNEYLISKNNLK